MDIRIPKLGEGADSGTVVNILVKEGDNVRKDQTLLELENEKAVAPIPATTGGKVQKIYVKVGDKVSVGQAIVALATDSATVVATKEESRQATLTPSHTPSPNAPHSLSASAPSQGNYYFESKGGLEPPASPTVRKIAVELGIDLRKVRGSEAGGRIVMADLKNYIHQLESRSALPIASPASSTGGRQAPSTEKVDFSKWGAIEKKVASSLRQKIGQKMVESWTSVPHVTQFDEADITALMELRKKFVPAYEKKGTKLTITPFIMKAVVAALKKHPIVNSSFADDTKEIIYKQYYHLGVAVDTEQGLIVPVLKDADKKSLLEISKELEALAEKTRQRKIALDDLKGGTFTLSNLGSIGGTFFTPIINTPEVAILGVGKGVFKPTAIFPKTTGKTKAAPTVEVRLKLPLGLSYDHRVVDGADGARFIRTLVENLENFDEKIVRI